ncbi:MAG: membrane protein [Chitinophagales bacterium]|nr:MAG: membrane protein [Chitinophagales bacterium]
MKASARYFFTLVVLHLLGSHAWGQVTISGKVIDELSREPLISANVIVKGTTIGAATDLDGVFKFEISDTVNQVTLVVSYIGYEDREIILKKPFQFTEIRLKNFVIKGEEVVISGSRIKESVMESGISIDKIDAREIKTAPSGNFYSGLNTLADIDVVSSSAAFNVVNMRGFNTTQPERSVQYIDGIDNQAPGLNFAVGNLMGANDLDLSSVEIIHGPSSALYGANAFQGVISMTTKDPFNFPGLGIQIKGGSRSYFDVQGRYARTFGKNNQWGFKLAAAYMRIDDWPADDDSANVYGDIEVEVNMSEIVRQLQYKEVGSVDGTDTFTQSDLDDAIALNNWLDFNPEANPGKKTIIAPGIPESAVADYNSNAWRINPTLYWRYKEDHEVSLMAKYGRGTAVYQGTNRYSLKDITFQQYKLEFKGKNYQAKAYATLENAGDTYDNVFTAINISKEGIGEYVSEYISTYFDALDSLVGGFSNCPDCVRPDQIERAKQIAEDSAKTKWILPGSPKFDSLFQIITKDPDLQTGSKFLDESKLINIDGYYNFRDLWDWMEILAGASYRVYLPKSYGTIFSDSLVNPADTLPDGRNDPDAEYHKIVTHEFGLFAQAIKRLLDNKLKLEFSIRMDKYTNFKPQLSPRGSIVFTHNDHTLRLSAASGYRLPTLQDQYIHLDLGPITLIGNLNGFQDSYTLRSVEDFWDGYDTMTVVPPDTVLEVYKINRLRPEKVRTVEVGYRTVHNKVLYIDFSFYHNWYTDFIGDIRVAVPRDGIAGEETGYNDIITRNYDLRQIPVNSKSTVRTWGFTVGLSYYFGRGITFKGNYTYSDINEKDIDDDLIPGFNTPKHKFNLGLEGKRVWKGLGFNSNFRWSDTYLWQGPFGDGQIPPFFTLDAQLNYEFKEYYTTIAVGGSNLLNRKYRTAYGSPLIGRMLYASLIFEINKL